MNSVGWWLRASRCRVGWLGAAIFAFYLAGEGDLAAPTVLLVLAGGFLWPVLPGAYAGFARSLLILGLASGFIAIGRRYVLDPGAR